MVAPRLAFEPFFVILLTDFRNNKNQNALKRNYYSVTIMYNQQQYDYAQQAAAMWSQYWQQASTMQQQQGNGQQVQMQGQQPLQGQQPMSGQQQVCLLRLYTGVFLKSKIQSTSTIFVASINILNKTLKILKIIFCF